MKKLIIGILIVLYDYLVIRKVLSIVKHYISDYFNWKRNNISKDDVFIDYKGFICNLASDSSTMILMVVSLIVTLSYLLSI